MSGDGVQCRLIPSVNTWMEYYPSTHAITNKLIEATHR